MRAVVQRVAWATVRVDGEEVASSGPGFLVLVAAGREDGTANAVKMADRIWGMRVFPDAEGKMNLNLRDWEAEGDGSSNVLLVSNFTVYGDATQRRPSFGGAASFDEGKVLFDLVVSELRGLGARVATGVYGADMKVELLNNGPVTLIVET